MARFAKLGINGRVIDIIEVSDTNCPTLLLHLTPKLADNGVVLVRRAVFMAHDNF